MISLIDGGFSIDGFELHPVAIDRDVIQWRVSGLENGYWMLQYVTFRLEDAVRWIQENATVAED